MPWAPAWPPDGRRIACAAGGDLWVMSAADTDRKSLTAPLFLTHAFERTTAPDSKRIAFVVTGAPFGSKPPHLR
jgi:hypothetical protein